MYSEEYLTQVEKAIQKLQSGERVVSIAYGDHVVRYAEVQINDLLNLRQRIKAELKIVGMKPKRKIVFSTSKGIDKIN
ncbi:gpW family protein [Wolbachia endosymbiont of Tribolium confusum]|uniref:gpW family protein n=1 Tax=Wolbachia endosymbiont of Tribolium confusum TaxID=214474 RepID=UPI001CF14CF5|nr:gpW family protein [Wolbachia endosymbiont of Tribolium confusum]MCA7010457.1 gpW family protein [Wolbachia endosymbiont of Tribolium confusum]